MLLDACAISRLHRETMSKGKILAALVGVFYFGFQTCSYASDILVINKFDQTKAHFLSLRDAIARANKLGRNNTIILTRGTYFLTNEDSVNIGDLDITNGNLTIVGQLGARVTIDASDSSLFGSRVFHVWPKAHLTLINLVLTGGRELFGGGIWNEGTVALDGCVITGNSSDIGDGGGVYNTGTLTVNHSTIHDNSAAAGNNAFDFGLDGFVIIITTTSPPGGNGGNGGGIYNVGVLDMKNSTITENSAGVGQAGYGGGNGGSGGGIFNAGYLALRHCIVSGNSSGAGGNGITGYLVGNGGNGGNGGGIFNSLDASHARLINTSVISNFAGQAGTGGVDGGSGLDGSGPNLFGDFTISR